MKWHFNGPHEIESESLQFRIDTRKYDQRVVDHTLKRLDADRIWIKVRTSDDVGELKTIAAEAEFLE